MDLSPHDILPLEEPEFAGTIGDTYVESKPDWPRRAAPPTGAPNIVVILLDDLGFGQLPATVVRLRRRTSHPSPRQGCATLTFIRRRCARRRALLC